jgi:hypothetical protein
MVVTSFLFLSILFESTAVFLKFDWAKCSTPGVSKAFPGELSEGN